MSGVEPLDEHTTHRLCCESKASGQCSPLSAHSARCIPSLSPLFSPTTQALQPSSSLPNLYSFVTFPSLHSCSPPDLTRQVSSPLASPPVSSCASGPLPLLLPPLPPSLSLPSPPSLSPLFARKVAHLRLSTPTQSIEGESGTMPLPPPTPTPTPHPLAAEEGLKPLTPHHAAGIRTEPPVHVFETWGGAEGCGWRWREGRSGEGRMEGRLVQPPVSVPKAKATWSAATTTAEPEEEPPGASEACLAFTRRKQEFSRILPLFPPLL